MTNSSGLYQFPKAEKLCSRKIIDAIYNYGKKIKSYPFILNYLEVEQEAEMTFPLQIVISVPKRKIRLAAKRNRLKRQIREAYRLNKKPLIDEVIIGNRKMALFLVYIGKEKETYSFIEKKLILLLDTLIKEIKNKTYED